jgi:signal transduction histidine kinase
MQEGLAEVIQRLRTLSFELSPAVLYRLGLASALSWLGDHVAAESGTSIKVVTEWEGEELHEELRIVVFQAVRELLSNAVKHAQAHQIEVRLRRSGGRATVEVSDDGQGFDPESLPPPSHLGGYGLFSLQQRLNHLGGRLQIISQIGHGARFLIEVPGSLPAHA